MAQIVGQQARLLGVSLVYGVLLGVLYGIFRVIRREIIHKDGMVHLEDFIYCIIAAFGLFYIFHVYNDGIMRGYVLLGTGIGALAYFTVCSSVFERMLGKVLALAVFLASVSFKCVSSPIKKSVFFVLKSLKKIGRTVRIVKSKI